MYTHLQGKSRLGQWLRGDVTFPLSVTVQTGQSLRTVQLRVVSHAGSAQCVALHFGHACSAIPAVVHLTLLLRSALVECMQNPSLLLALTPTAVGCVPFMLPHSCHLSGDRCGA